MRYEIEVNGRSTQVVVTRHERQLVVSIGDVECVVDAATAGSQMLSLLIEKRTGSASTSVESREIVIARDGVSGRLTLGIGAVAVPVHLNAKRRRGREAHAQAGGNGPLRITAPMPGKVVRVLAQAGDRVSARQPVVVIEAMKMENELRAAGDGVVSEMLVQPGQSVEAGTLLAVITSS